MSNRLLTLCIIFMVCVNSSFAQERKKIDRTGQEEKKTSTSSSSKSSTTLSSTKKTASNKPTQQSYFRISSQSASFDANGGNKTFTISSSGSWKINVNTASWGHLTRNGNTLTLKVDANNSTSSRTDYFIIKSGNVEKRVNISQSGQTILTSSKTSTIKSVTVSNDVDVDGKKGLSVHVSFDISGMKEKDAMVSCYFYNDSGKALVNTNENYGTTGTPSYVAVSKNIKPRYENSTFSDLEIKIPYEELHLYGTYSRTLRVDVIIWDYSTSNNAEITRKENTFFTCIPNLLYLKIDGSTSDKTKYFGESGGRVYYSVDTSANSYETWGVPSWCSIENKTSSGFTLVCNKNINRSSRSDYMKVKAAGKEIRIDIKQEASSGPTATINNLWVKHNVFNGMTKGIRIHINLDVNGMKGRTVKYCVFFYKENNQTKLVNIYGNHISASSTGTPNYDNSNWSDWWIFVPYTTIFSAANSNGRFSLDVEIQDMNGNLLTRKENYQFHQN